MVFKPQIAIPFKGNQKNKNTIHNMSDHFWSRPFIKHNSNTNQFPNQTSNLKLKYKHNKSPKKTVIKNLIYRLIKQDQNWV